VWSGKPPEALRSTYLKLARADVHLSALVEGITSYEASAPFIVQEDVNGRVRTLTARIKDEPDPVLGVILGDLVHNLRSSLDHIVWQLALTSTSKPRRQTSMPLATTPTDFASARRSLLRDVPGEAVAALERIQPYAHAVFGDDPFRHPLTMLHELWNVDKHRRLVVASAWADPSHVAHDLPRKSIGEIRFFRTGDRSARVEVPVAVKREDVHFEVKVGLLGEEPPLGEWPLRDLAVAMYWSTSEAVSALRDALFV
jgi:hypothetical protein